MDWWRALFFCQEQWAFKAQSDTCSCHLCAVFSFCTWKCLGLCIQAWFHGRVQMQDVEIHETGCIYSCVCIIYRHICENIILRLWLGFISTCREYRAEQNNMLIYSKSFFRASHFTQQPSWQLFSCHARLASSCFTGIKTKTVFQITNANPVQLMQNVF